MKILPIKLVFYYIGGLHELNQVFSNVNKKKSSIKKIDNQIINLVRSNKLD